MKSRFHLTIVAASAAMLGSPTILHAQDKPSRVAQANLQQSAEADRVQLVQSLLKRRAELVRKENTKELQACDQEIKRHPAPADSDTSALAKRFVGKWRSSRHDHLYRADGTWTLLPVEKGTLHGRWKITGNRIEVTSGYAAPESTDHYTLILLTEKDYVFTDGGSVFCETRLTP